MVDALRGTQQARKDIQYDPLSALLSETALA
jgi:hypothetical protein